MAKIVEVAHGSGPVTSIVGRVGSVEVEWDARIESLVDSGRLSLVGKRPYKRKKKADVAEDAGNEPDTVAGFTGALNDTGEFTAEAGASDWSGD